MDALGSEFPYVIAAVLWLAGVIALVIRKLVT
jgi:hypothetical protein